MAESWFDEFIGVAVRDQYLINRVGGGDVGVAANPSIGGWLELSTDHNQSSIAQVRFETEPAQPAGPSWGSIGQQRVLINTTTDLDVAIGFVSTESASEIGGLLYYLSDLQAWVFQTGTNGQLTTVPIDWLHTPGQAFDVRIESSAEYSAAFIDGVEVARVITNLPASPVYNWDAQLSNKEVSDGYSAPKVWLDYLWTAHDPSALPAFDRPIDTVTWTDQFASQDVAAQYWISRTGTGQIDRAGFGEWLDISAGSSRAGSARIRVGEDDAVSPHDAMNWYAGLNAVGEQRVIVNTTQNIHLTIGFMSRDDPSNIGAGLLYRHESQQWFFQTVSNGVSNNIPLGWNHTPGVAFTVRIETGDGYSAAFINGTEVARTTMSVPSDLPYVWENQLWTFPPPGASGGPDAHMWVDYMLVEQDRGEQVVFNRPVSEDNWISGSREGQVADLDSAWRIEGAGDFSGDGTIGLLLLHETSGEVRTWSIDDEGFFDEQITVVTSLSPTWQILGTGNFNGAGPDEILLRSSSSGSLVSWTMDDGDFAGQKVIMKNYDPTWVVVGDADLNGDGTSDIVLRSSHSGTIVSWTMQNGSYAGQNTYLKNAPSDWEIEGFGDFNADGVDDILLRYEVTGTLITWTTDSNGRFGSQQVIANNLDFDWELQGIGDINADGADDLFFRDNSTGTLEVWSMSESNLDTRSVLADSAGSQWRISAVGDVNGDTGSDLVWRNSLTGATMPWVISLSALGLSSDSYYVVS